MSWHLRKHIKDDTVFLSADTVYYLEGGDAEVNAYVRSHVADIEAAMGDTLFPFTLLYLANDNARSNGRLYCRLLPKQQGGRDKVLSVELLPVDNILARIHSFALQVLEADTEALEPDTENLARSVVRRKAAPARWISDVFSPPSCLGSAPGRKMEYIEAELQEDRSPLEPLESPLEPLEPLESPLAPPSSLRSLAQRIRDELLELQRQNGIEVLISELGEDFIAALRNLSVQPPSPLLVDDSFRIFVENSHSPNTPSLVSMPTLSRVVYFLFLRHIEGIRLKEIADYKEELMNIYMTVSPRDDVEQMHRSIDDMVDLESGSLNQKISRITAAFRSLMPADMAQHYIITGPRGERRRILLDRSLVTLPAELC